MDTWSSVSPTLKYAVAALTLVVGAGVIGMSVLELRHWRSGSTLIDRSQLGLRLGGAGLLLIILGMVFFGVFFAEILRAPPVFLSFWTVCMALAALLFVIAVIDLRRLAAKHRSRENEVYEEFARLVREEIVKRTGGAVEPPPGSGASPEPDTP